MNPHHTLTIPSGVIRGITMLEALRYLKDYKPDKNGEAELKIQTFKGDIITHKFTRKC